MKKIIAAVAFAAAVSAGAAASANEFVTNGDFTNLTNGVGQLGFNTTAVGWSSAAPENSYNFVMTDGNAGSNGEFGNVSLWTQANAGNGWNGLAAGPGNFVALDGAFHDGPLTQQVNGLTVGQTYHLSFNYAFSQQQFFNGDTTQNIMVSLGGFSATSADFALASHAFSGWNSANFDIVAGAASETLTFFSTASPQAPPFALVSNVSLTGGVPEPASWAMLLIGFGGLGAMARLRARKVAGA